MYITRQTMKAQIKVQKRAPMNPSHVLLGDSLVNGLSMNLRPATNPHM